jgi:hypothetical protein
MAWPTAAVRGTRDVPRRQPEVAHGGSQDQEGLGAALAHLHQAVQAEHAAEALDGVQPFRLEAQGLGAEVPAADGHAACHRRGSHGQHEGREQHERRQGQVRQGRHQVAGILQGTGIEAEGVRHEVLGPGAEIAAAGEQRAGAGDEHRRHGQLPGAGHLALAAGIVQALRCRLFCAFLELFFGHGRPLSRRPGDGS